MGRIYVNQNQLLVKEMIKIYNPGNIDWMSFEITRKNTLTFHHIVEECFGGPSIIENGALLTKRGHRILNILGDNNYMIYDDWNDLFKEINKSQAPLDDYFKKYSKELKEESLKLIYK